MNRGKIMIIVLSYISSALIFVGIDFIWLSNMMPRLYQPVMGDILLAKPNLFAALAFYLIYPIGLVVFAILPAMSKSSLFFALQNGALYGFLTYATYDLTNHATLRNWSLSLTVFDMIWGSILSGLTSVLTFLIISKFAVNFLKSVP